MIAVGGAGCGDDDEATIGTPLTGATGESDAAADAESKIAARTAQTVVEAIATGQNGSYAGIDAAALVELDPSLTGADIDIAADDTSFTITVAGESGAVYTVARTSDGATEYTCEPTGTGGCPDDGDWN